MSAIQGRQSVSSQPPVGGVGQHQLGGAHVQQSSTGGLRSIVSGIARSVQAFVSNLSAKFDNWKQGRALEASTRRADAAADTIVTAMKDGTLSPSSSAAFDALMKASTQADANHPMALAERAVSAKLAALPQAERTKACFTDFDTFGTGMKALTDHRIDAADVLMTELADVGLAPASTVDPQAAKARAGAEIDNLVGVLKGAARDQRLADLQSFSKGAFTIATDGQVSGTVVNARVPDELSSGSPPPSAAHGTIHTAVSLIEARCQGRIDSHNAAAAKNPAARTPDDKKRLFPQHNGIPVTSQSVGDFHRMNINIDNNGAIFNTKLPPNSNDRISTNVNNSVTALRNFAGSDQATTVLSAVTHQYDLRDLVRTFSGPSGETVEFKPLPKGFDHVQALLPGGAVETFDRPGQIGDAQITLSHTPAGDFKVSVTWDFLGARLISGGEEVPTDPSNPRHAPNIDDAAARAVVPNVLKIQLDASFVVSAADAAAGRLTIDPTSARFQQTISGKMAVPA